MSTTNERQTLRIVTFPKHAEQPPEPCTGGYTCSCWACDADRAHRVNQGIRPTTSIPTRKAA